MKLFHQDGARRKGVAVGVLAASMLASVLALAPSAHAQPYTIEVEGCDADEFIEAVEIANAIPATDIIVLDDKCKYEFENPYFDEDAGPPAFTYNALPVITDDLTIYGNKSKAVGDGDDNGGFRFMEIDGVTVEIRDLTISGFELSIPPADPSALAFGAGILNDGGDLTLRNSAVKDNEVTLLNLPGASSGTGGGGILSLDGSVTLRSSTVSGNEVNLVNLLGDFAAASAGGIATSGGDGLDIRSSTVKGNKVNAVGIAADALAAGGGLIVIGGGELTMDQTAVASNSVSTRSSAGNDSTAEAGGIFLDETGFTHEIARSTITGNRASAKGGSLAVAIGGGIVNVNEESGGLPGLLVDETDGPAILDLDPPSGSKSTISNNKATCDGVCVAAGGGYVNADLIQTDLGAQGDAEFNRTVFKGNKADGDDGIGVGGGLAILGDAAGDPELVLNDATVTKNAAKGDAYARGGGIFTTEVEAVDIDESDIYKNKPDDCWALDVGDFCDFS